MSDKADKLYQIAEGQQGFFTARQAMACGYPTSHHVHHVQTGTWQKHYRGIYRLTHFPMTDDAQYILWSLWSRDRMGNPQGVYSHQTALALYELSDVMPKRLHMTVPTGFRKTAATPDILVLHRAMIAENEMEQRKGFRITKPIRALSDLIDDESVSVEILHEALQQGLARGIIRRAELEKHPKHKTFRNLMQKIRP